MAKEQETKKNQELQTRSLPKNFRQIGEPGAKKIYMEDYVYTYLNKLAQPGNLYARGAVLFGKLCHTTAGNCMFISGAAACQNFEFDLEESVFTEENWNEVYRLRDKFFPELEIVGWFLSRMGFSTELNDKIVRTHMDNFGGENKVLYMIDALENEDAFYQFENFALKKQRGYYIYYETNKEMKEYMLAEGEMEERPEEKRRSSTIQRDSSVVKNYKKAMKKKKKLSQKSSPTFGPASLAGVLVMVMVLFYGARSVRQFRMEENVEEVFHQQTMETDEKSNTEENETVYTGKDAVQKEEKEDSVSAARQKTEDVRKPQYEMESSTTAIWETKQEQVDGTEEQVGTESTWEEENETESAEETWTDLGKQYIVQRGDTLAEISKRMYQSYDYVEMLAEVNQIDNLDEIYPGQVLDIPSIED